MKEWNRERELENLNRMMEEMAGESEHGKHEPGEKQKRETMDKKKLQENDEGVKT